VSTTGTTLTGEGEGDSAATGPLATLANPVAVPRVVGRLAETAAPADVDELFTQAALGPRAGDEPWEDDLLDELHVEATTAHESMVDAIFEDEWGREF
jgi:hypothetical protein